MSDLIADHLRSFDEDPEDPAVLKREIERLRERHSQDNERMAGMVEAEIENLARIEQLEGHIIAQRDYRITLTSREKRLKERIEELENENKVLQSVVSPQTARSWHIITDAQIDAVVEWVESRDEGGCSTSLHSVIRDAVWLALNKLNIVRCEGCGGSGKVKRIPPRYETEQPCPDCAPWGSEGWVKK